MSVDEEHFAANLRLVREETGLTQSALAKAMSERGFRWHQATVYKIENGERQIQLGEARQVADIFGVSLTDMLKRPERSSVERQLDYDINRFTATFDLIGWRVVELEEARNALVESTNAARRLADADADIAAKLRVAEELLQLSPDESLARGKKAVGDETLRHVRRLYHEKYGVHQYRMPTTAELITEIDQVADGPEA